MVRPIPTRRLARGSIALGIAGFTLLELIMACAILLVLSTAAVPLARMTVQRQREVELHRALREIRTAVDRYKDDADKNLIRTEVGSQGYPPDLQTLVDGVTVSTAGGGAGGISASALGGREWHLAIWLCSARAHRHSEQALRQAARRAARRRWDRRPVKTSFRNGEYTEQSAIFAKDPGGSDDGKSRMGFARHPGRCGLA